MRIITSYACTLDVETAEEAAWRFSLYRGVMDDWLHDQGISDPRADSPEDTFVQLKRRDVSHKDAEIDGFLLKQSIEESSHILHTRFDLGVRDHSLALFLQFSVERRTDRIAPVGIQVGSPRAIQTIFDSGHWMSGQARVRPHSRHVIGAEAGEQLAQEIMDTDRTLPFVLLANLVEPEEGWHQRSSYQPYEDADWADFVNRLEDDLGGIAQLVELDTSAANTLIPADSPIRGRRRPVIGYQPPEFSEWGMNGSLIRIVWPIGRQGFFPDLHPAWAPFEHFYEVDDEDGHDYPIHHGGSGTPPPSWVNLFRGHELMAVRSEVRNTIYEQAALQPCPSLIDDMRREFEQTEREKLSETGDWERMAQSFERDALTERQRADGAEARIDSLERDIENLSSKNRELERRFQTEKRASQNVLTADTEDSTMGNPSSIAQAIELAVSQFTNLSFAQNCAETISSLNAKSGPPRKVYRDLRLLDSCAAQIKEKDSIGNDIIAWLKSRGANVSLESDSRLHHHPQDFIFETKRHTFETMSQHFKYHGAGKDSEVRIYFRVHREPDKPASTTIDIGYVGPKIQPD